MITLNVHVIDIVGSSDTLQYTGCDSMSSFAGRGKIAFLKLQKINTELQPTFGDLGDMWDVSESLLNKLEAFTYQMYATTTTN